MIAWKPTVRRAVRRRDLLDRRFESSFTSTTTDHTAWAPDLDHDAYKKGARCTGGWPPSTRGATRRIRDRKSGCPGAAGHGDGALAKGKTRVLAVKVQTTTGGAVRGARVAVRASASRRPRRRRAGASPA
jgi:hypothetical protein